MRVVLFVAAVLAVVGTSVSDRRPKNCKDVVRNVIMDSCKGPREKRSPQRNDLESLNQQMSKTIEMEVMSDDGNHLQKRQFPPYDYRLPGERLQEMFQGTDLNLPWIGNFENRFTNIDESYGPSVPLGPSMFYRSARYATKSVDPDDLLGFTLSSEELEELHEEIGDRIARNSKETFLTIAKKCCLNAKLCNDNPGLVPCMGY